MLSRQASRSSFRRRQNHAPIVVLSDRALITDLMVSYLRGHGFAGATGAAGCAGLVRFIPPSSSGVILVDLGMESEDPRELLRDARVQRPDATLVAIGTPMQLAAQAGDADGWIELSDPGDRLSEIAAAATAHQGGHARFPVPPLMQRQLRTWGTLTPRQRQVLGLLGCGLDNKRLASTLHLSERAVKAHVTTLLAKFKADNRTELALIASYARLHAPPGLFPFRS